MIGRASRIANWIETLEEEWSPDEGFFWRLRNGEFHQERFEATLRKLSEISTEGESDVSRRLVSLLWYIPTFMTWQKERIEKHHQDVDAYAKSITAVTNEIERILGVP